MYDRCLRLFKYRHVSTFSNWLGGNTHIVHGVDSVLLFNSYCAICVLNNGQYLLTDVIEKCVCFSFNEYDMNGPKIKMGSK